MVRVVVVRIGVPVLANEEAPAWARRKQVHLVRFDEHGSGLPPQPERAAREVEETAGVADSPNLPNAD